MSDSPVDTRELDDLQQLVQSEGFTRFQAHVEQEWGATAQVRQIDAALRELKPGEYDAELMTVSQIRAAAIQVQRIARWPVTRIAELKGAKPKPLNPMDLLRRRPR